MIFFVIKICSQHTLHTLQTQKGLLNENSNCAITNQSTEQQKFLRNYK